MITFNIHKVKYGKVHNYNRMLKSVQYDNRISPLARLVHLTMLESNNYKPTLNRIAKQYEVSPRQLDNIIVELKKFGYIVSSGSKEHTVYDVYAIPVNANYCVKKYKKRNAINCVNVNAVDCAVLKDNDSDVEKSTSDSLPVDKPIDANSCDNCTEDLASDFVLDDYPEIPFQ